MPKFDKSKRYQDKNGRKFGEGVWLDDSGKPIMLGQGRYDKESNTVKQYNSDGTVTTFTRQDWVKKQQKDHEMRVLQNDRKYAAPYLPEKAMTIHTNVDGKAGRIDLSENQLDSIAVNAKRAGLPFQTALGISYKESTLGQHQERKAGTALTPWLKTISNPFDKSDSRAQQAREVSYTGVQSPTLVISNWKQKLESPYAEYIYDSKLIPRDSKQSKEGPRTEQYYDENFLSSLYWGNRYKLKDENPLEHGFREYKKDPSRWNPGETGYEEDVKAKGRQLMQSPEIQEYVKRKNVKSEGGFLQPKDAWDALSMREMADMMKVAVRNGITDLKTIREKYNEFAEGGGHLYDGTTEKSQKMDRRGYVPSDAIRKRIEQYEGKAMTGAIDPLSGRYARNNSFESEAGRFYSVLPESIRERVLSNPELADNLYSYSYNVGAGNFKSRVVPVLEKYYAGEAGADDVASSMWASGDRKLRGLQKRRAEERNGVLGALQGGQGTGISQAAVSEQHAFMPYDLGELFPAMPASDAVQMPSEAELRRQQRDAERLERRNRLQSMMDILDMVYGRSSDNPLVSNGLLGPLGALMYGGGGHLFDGQSEPTQQMNIMAYHPDEDYYTGPASKLPEVTVTGKAPSWFGKKGLYPTGPRYKSGQWVSPKGAGNMTVMPGDDEMVFLAPIAAGAGIAASPAIAGAASSLAPGSAFWMNPITQQVAASTLGGTAVDAGSTLLTGNTVGGNVRQVVTDATGWKGPENKWARVGYELITDMANPGYMLGSKRPGFDLFPSPMVPSKGSVQMNHGRNFGPFNPDDFNNWGSESLTHMTKNYAVKVPKKAKTPVDVGPRTFSDLGWKYRAAVNQKLAANKIGGFEPYEYIGYHTTEGGYTPVFRQKRLTLMGEDTPEGVAFNKEALADIEKEMGSHSGLWKSWNVGDYGPAHNIGKNEEGVGRLFDANYSREPFTWIMQNFPRKWEVSPIGNARILGTTLNRKTDE